MNNHLVRTGSENFRLATIACRYMLPIGLKEFPQGACGDASLLLGTYLTENGHGQFNYICGEKRIGVDCQFYSHAWLEQNGIIIDITADQFEDVDEPVIVSRDSEWHREWERQDEYIANFREQASAMNGLTEAYRIILDHIEMP